MTDRPYTDDDLRDAAALMHYALTTEPNPADADTVLSAHPAWANVEVGSDEEGQLRESVVELVSGAADVSEWAINLGTDGLQPSTEYEITLNTDRPVARIHFAFAPTMPKGMRAALVQGLGDAIDEAEALLNEPEEQADSDSAVFGLIAEIASRLRVATDEGEYHAVGLIADLAGGRTTVAEARAELAELTFRHV